MRRLVTSARAVTLTGIGGAGKTRLSLRVAADAVEATPDGVWQVRLEGITDPAHVVTETAVVLGILEQAGRPVVDTLIDQLRRKSLLIVLDNCEHAGYCRESLAMRREIGDKRGIAESLDCLAAIQAARGSPLDAGRLWGAAEALREAIGISLPPADREERDRSLAAARGSADEAAFAPAWSEGHAASLEQILPPILDP